LFVISLNTLVTFFFYSSPVLLDKTCTYFTFIRLSSLDIDIEDNDGVYSNIFSPTERGMHHISIEALSPKPPECSFTNTPFAASLEVQFVQQVQGKAILPSQGRFFFLKYKKLL
jgi:hypothetical protein